MAFLTPSNTGIWRLAANIALAIFLVLAITEILLRVPALMGQNLATPERDFMRRHVLAVGDSLTRTHGVPEEETYPAHLQQLLDETAPETFRTVNLGVIGVSSSFVATQLPDHLKRYQPEFVVVWVGSNIRSDMTRGHDAEGTLDASFLIQHSEIYRFIRTWLQDREIENRAKEIQEQQSELSEADALRAGQKRLRTEKMFLETMDEGRMQEFLVRDYRRIVETVRTSGAKVIFITYPFDLGPSARANRVMLQVASELDIPLVSSGKAAARVPENERKWLWALHPTGPIYREIAVDVATVIQAQSETGTTRPLPHSNSTDPPR